MSETGFVLLFGGMVLFLPAIYGLFGRSLAAAFLAGAVAALGIPAYAQGYAWTVPLIWIAAWIAAALIVRAKQSRIDAERRHREVLAAVSGRALEMPKASSPAFVRALPVLALPAGFLVILLAARYWMT